MESELWRTVLSGAVATSTAALAWVWRKASNSASREELAATMTEFRVTTQKLFENADRDRRMIDARFAEQTKQLHVMYVELRDKIDAVRK